ncbi:MAG: cytochrome c biogenesis protein CcsA [Desulfobacterales bacterium]|nr:cytochrome c biogenesis protein CcsA [Desulfobacterales bacterium]
MLQKQSVMITFTCIAGLMMMASLYTIFVYAPVEKTMGVVQKIFYFHVPSAFISFFAFFITFIASILYLYKRDLKWDAIAACSVEIGVMFCSIVLITGPIWAKPTWNVWWTWDPRLTTTLILWFIYISYLMLRSVVRENQRANMSAVYGIIGFVNVPITFFAIRLWRSIHPLVITAKGMSISPPMKTTLMLALITFCLLYFTLLVARVRLELLQMEVETIRNKTGHYY